MADENTTTDIDETEDEAVDTFEAHRDDKRAALDAERAAADAVTDESIVEARSADSEETKAARKTGADEHVKVFVIPGDEERPTKDNYDHDPNIAATRNYMMSQGLRPTGDVVFKGAEAFGPGGKSWALTYGGPAVPAERFDFQQVGVLDQQTDEAPGEDDEPKAPTDANTRAEIDEYAGKLEPALDTTGAKDNAEALALIAAHKPTE